MLWHPVAFFKAVVCYGTIQHVRWLWLLCRSILLLVQAKKKLWTTCTRLDSVLTQNNPYVSLESRVRLRCNCKPYSPVAVLLSSVENSETD